MNTIENLSEYIYRELGVINPDRIASYKTMILDHDNVQMLAHNFRSYSLGYCQEFMLSIPEFWLNMNVNDWYRLGSSLSPRPEMGGFMRLINSSGYYDMIFLEKYLGIDSKDYISNLITTEDEKNKMYMFRDEYYLSFKRQKTHLEDLKIFYNLKEDPFVNTCKKLVAAGMRLKPTKPVSYS